MEQKKQNEIDKNLRAAKIKKGEIFETTPNENDKAPVESQLLQIRDDDNDENDEEDETPLRKFTFGIFTRPFKNGDRVKLDIPEASVGLTQAWRIEYCGAD